MEEITKEPTEEISKEALEAYVPEEEENGTN